jgi:alpha-glucosidase
VELVQRMRAVLKEFDASRLMIGELYHSPERLVRFYGESAGGAQMPHNQMLVLLPWKAEVLRDAIERYLAAIPEDCWPNCVLSNHDKPRIATRVGRPAQARVARMLLCTLFGTPTLYYGDELGMENVPIPPGRLRDPFEQLDPGRGQGRDPQRTPMPWEPGAPHAGFTEGEPWLPLGEDWREVNVEVQRARPDSMLHLTRTLLALRRAEPAFSVGRHRLVLNEGPVLAYRREHESGSFLVALNLSREYTALAPPRGWDLLQPVLSTLGPLPPGELRGPVQLRPDEGLILRKR